ncbi:RpoL/Rpb11 RNA polymerase subunit family protein [Candidatus Pyrohabitans sp.]
MEIKVIRENESELEFELAGENHTFCNVLRRALNQKDEVEAASYRIAHPLLSQPVVYLRVKAGIEVPRTGEKEVEITAVPGIGPKRKEQLAEAGIKTANELLRADLDDLAEKTGIARSILERYVSEAKKLDYGIPSPPRYVLKQVLEEVAKEFDELQKKLEN